MFLLAKITYINAKFSGSSEMSQVLNKDLIDLLGIISKNIKYQ